MNAPITRVTVIVPARDEAHGIVRTLRAIRGQDVPGVDIEMIVVDDGSTDATVECAKAAGAKVLSSSRGRNPAAARNLGAAHASGDPLIFLDADCVPGNGWLAAIIDRHQRGESIVGGSLALPPNLGIAARCDYYCGWYVVHPGRRAGYVPHAPAPNVSVRRAAFFDSEGFEELPYSVAAEERHWQAELRGKGHRICFEPAAVAFHYHRPGLSNLLRRNYRWGYGAIESKHRTGCARLAWIYRFPRTLIALSIPLAFAHAAYVLGCWLRAGVFEPVWMSPLVLLAKLAHGFGMMRGGIDWLSRRDIDSRIQSVAGSPK